MIREQTRKREHGTQVTNTNGDPQVKIDAFRQIVTDKSYSKIDGVAIDLFSASAVIAVYDALSEENRVKFLVLSVVKMCKLAYKLLK